MTKFNKEDYITLAGILLSLLIFLGLVTAYGLAMTSNYDKVCAANHGDGSRYAGPKWKVPGDVIDYLACRTPEGRRIPM